MRPVGKYSCVLPGARWAAIYDTGGDFVRSAERSADPIEYHPCAPPLGWRMGATCSPYVCAVCGARWELNPIVNRWYRR